MEVGAGRGIVGVGGKSSGWEGIVRVGGELSGSGWEGNCLGEGTVRVGGELSGWEGNCLVGKCVVGPAGILEFSSRITSLS